ncbi:hypothetical protein OAO01_04990 [Oligoflexia bacterium]|nr:hypothetical protein [Oligoflexia bacterium]
MAAKKEREEYERCNSDNIGAYVMAQDFVKENLKSPSTAKFPWGTSDSTIVNLGDCKYRVKSYVDAQNSFGGMIRNNYDVVVRYNGNNRWGLVEVDIK